ncbi:MAG: DUF1194 domain-containing protein [Alphaproteobacteria bacterium]|nr:DUF1194 domain-containing protein [Alphaproteobacteria bacterium]
MKPNIAAIVILILCGFTGQSRAAGVDIEVVLAADVSRSIDDAEFDLQRKGYAAALTDPRVLTAIRGRAGAAVGVCFVEWSGDEDQNVVVDWSEIRDEEDAGGVAAAILAAPRSFMGRTSISAAIDFAMAQFAKSKWQKSRRIIDISGDGTNNSGRPVTEARDQATAQGTTINGLAIINNKPNLGYSAHTQPPGGLPSYYRQNVIGGPNAFLLVVKDFNSFADAMANKLAKEIDVAGARPVRSTALLLPATF